ncbi:SLC13 family permease [Saccharopolyspora sp. NPDC050642]|uniref:SLC13 family permease n=1 Tax=Saccharopolyspora sp. NPDC050642 TaxID=3157099 RepID=UPI00340E12B2
MTPSLLSIVVLALLFLGAFVPRFSLALAALPAAFLVAAIADVDIDELFGFFPVDFVVLIVGITALFAVAQSTGTTDWLLDNAVRRIGDRVALLPLLLFGIGTLITALGTLPAAAIAIMAPITMGLAARRGLPPLLMCLVMLHGIMCGLFSPIAVFGATAPRLLDKADIPVPAHTSPALLLASVGTGLLACLAAMAVARRSLARAAAPLANATDPDPADAAPAGAPSSSGTATAIAPAAVRTEARAAAPEWLSRAATITALVLLVVGGVAFKLNLGLLGLSLAFVLQLVLRVKPADVIDRIPWGIILLIAGVLTYIGLMEHLGAFERVSAALQFTGSPMLSLLAVCAVTGVTSFFASSIAVIATAVPLMAPLVDAGVSPVGAIIAIALSAVIVDVNPLSGTGAIILSSTAPEQREKLFRQLMVYGLCSVVVGPPLVWAVFGWL